MVFKTFTTLSRRASQKGPSFFDSAYHLRNYTQLIGPDSFTSNTSKENSNGGSNSYPKQNCGVYSYSFLLDPYTSTLVYNSNNNNRNKNKRGVRRRSSNPMYLGDEEYFKKQMLSNNGKHKKLPPPVLLNKTDMSVLEVPAILKYNRGARRAYATIQEIPEESLLQHYIESAPILDLTKSVTKSKFSKSVNELQREIDFSTNPLHKSLLTQIYRCFLNEDNVEVYALYQAIKRNELPMSVSVFNVVLNATKNRYITGESVESKLTTILNIYSDMISLQLKPNSTTYEIVLSSLLQGAFSSFEMFLVSDSVETTLDDNGAVTSSKIDKGTNYFKLAIDIFMAGNVSKIHTLDHLIYELILTGLNVFNYRFSEPENFIQFLNILNASKCFVKNEIYYINLMRFVVNQQDDKSSAYKFLINIYNEFKQESAVNVQLLKQQFNVYSVLLYSLIQVNQISLATKILDNLLIAVRQDNSLAYTSQEGYATPEPRSPSLTPSTVSPVSEIATPTSFSSFTPNTSPSPSFIRINPGEVNQILEINKVIAFYLTSLIDNNLDKSLELFEKFTKFDLISNNPITNQLFINFLMRSCELQDFEKSEYIYNKYIAENDALLNYKMQEFSVTDTRDKVQLSLTSLITCPKSLLYNRPYSLSFALDQYIALSIQSQKTAPLGKFLEFDQTNHLAEAAKVRCSRLGESAIYNLVGVMLTGNFNFQQMVDLLNQVPQVDANSLLSKLMGNNQFLYQIYMTNGHGSYNLLDLFESAFFLRCTMDFTVKSYVNQCELGSLFSNKYYGLIQLWFGYWDIELANHEATNREYLVEEFDNLDNFYLEKNIDSELASNKSNSDFVQQLKWLNQFKTRLMAHEPQTTETNI